jgi:hypothetical protein
MWRERTSHEGRLVLGTLAGQVTEIWEVARSEKALIQIDPGTLYFPIFSQGKEVGGVFIGSGYYLVDAIAETRRGAVGKSIEYSWNGSLLVLTLDGDWSPPQVSEIRKGDLKRLYIESEGEANWRAQQILERFGNPSDESWHFRPGRRQGWIATILDIHQGKTQLVSVEDNEQTTNRDSTIESKSPTVGKNNKKEVKGDEEIRKSNNQLHRGSSSRTSLHWLPESPTKA